MAAVIQSLQLNFECAATCQAPRRRAVKNWVGIIKSTGNQSCGGICWGGLVYDSTYVAKCTDMVKTWLRDTLGMLPHCKIGIKSNAEKFNVIYQLNRCASGQRGDWNHGSKQRGTGKNFVSPCQLLCCSPLLLPATLSTPTISTPVSSCWLVHSRVVYSRVLAPPC